MISIALPVLVGVFGFILYYFTERTKLNMLGLIMFGVGLFFTLQGSGPLLTK